MKSGSDRIRIRLGRENDVQRFIRRLRDEIGWRRIAANESRSSRRPEIRLALRNPERVVAVEGLTSVGVQARVVDVEVVPVKKFDGNSFASFLIGKNFEASVSVWRVVVAPEVPRLNNYAWVRR